MLSGDKATNTAATTEPATLTLTPPSAPTFGAPPGSSSSPSRNCLSSAAAVASSSSFDAVATPEESVATDGIAAGKLETNHSAVEEAASSAAAVPPLKRARTDSASEGNADEGIIAAASEVAAPSFEVSASPYTDLQRAVHTALESKAPALTTSDKVALALEVLRARQLELDLAQARNNIEALVTKSGSAPRTLRSVIPASTVKGLPIGTPIEITAGKFLLSPTTNDPQALFLTLELQNFGEPCSDTRQFPQTQPAEPIHSQNETRLQSQNHQSGLAVPSEVAVQDRKTINGYCNVRENVPSTSLGRQSPAPFPTSSTEIPVVSGENASAAQNAGPRTSPIIPNGSGGSPQLEHTIGHTNSIIPRQNLSG